MGVTGMDRIESSRWLSSLATVLLVAGYVLIRRGKVEAHKRMMLTAFATSVLFLACYLTYHGALHQYTGAGHRSFEGVGLLKTVYLLILVSHVLLAITVPVLALITIARGLKGDWLRHRRIARVTFPIWLYVSVTGVIIYWMLYHLSAG